MAEAMTINGEPLSETESAALAQLEAVVDRGLASFVEVGNALLAIRAKKLYRGVSDTFEGYCQVKWNFSRRRADQLIDAASIVATFGDGVSNENHGSQIAGAATESRENHGSQNGQPQPTTVPPPQNERQARELLKVPEERRQQVWNEAVETAPAGANGKPAVTAAHVKRVAEKGAGDLREASHGVPAESTAAPAPLYDAALILIPPHLRPAFEAAPLFDKALEHFRQITTLTNQIGEGPAAAHFKVGVSFERDLRNARDVVKFARPYVVCPHCKGSGRGNGCSPGTGCRGMGWMTQDQYERVPPELKAQKGAA
jgi:hypothetical protein